MWPQTTPSTPRFLASAASSRSNEPMKFTAFLTLSFAQAENDQYGRPSARRAALKWVLTNSAKSYAQSPKKASHFEWRTTTSNSSPWMTR